MHDQVSATVTLPVSLLQSLIRSSQAKNFQQLAYTNACNAILDVFLENAISNPPNAPAPAAHAHQEAQTAPEGVSAAQDASTVPVPTGTSSIRAALPHQGAAVIQGTPAPPSVPSNQGALNVPAAQSATRSQGASALQSDVPVEGAPAASITSATASVSTTHTGISASNCVGPPWPMHIASSFAEAWASSLGKAPPTSSQSQGVLPALDAPAAPAPPAIQSAPITDGASAASITSAAEGISTTHSGTSAPACVGGPWPTHVTGSFAQALASLGQGPITSPVTPQNPKLRGTGSQASTPDLRTPLGHSWLQNQLAGPAQAPGFSLHLPQGRSWSQPSFPASDHGQLFTPHMVETGAGSGDVFLTHIVNDGVFGEGDAMGSAAPTNSLSTDSWAQVQGAAPDPSATVDVATLPGSSAAQAMSATSKSTSASFPAKMPSKPSPKATQHFDDDESSLTADVPEAARKFTSVVKVLQRWEVGVSVENLVKFARFYFENNNYPDKDADAEWRKSCSGTMTIESIVRDISPWVSIEDAKVLGTKGQECRGIRLVHPNRPYFRTRQQPRAWIPGMRRLSPQNSPGFERAQKRPRVDQALPYLPSPSSQPSAQPSVQLPSLSSALPSALPSSLP